MKDLLNGVRQPVNRRSFMKKGFATAGTATVGAALLTNSSQLLAEPSGENRGHLTRGDAALLRFAAAAEILETDFWVQYNELAGVQDDEVPGGSGNPEYQEKFEDVDDDFPQYIHDNTDDEFTHQNFLNAYLVSKGADPVDLEQFRTLPGSTATGSSGKLRLTNLMQLTLDTSWYTRYRIDNKNPDLDPNFVFPQAQAGLAKGQFTAIPRTDDDLTPDDHLQAIVNTAIWHMPTIEQGGNSLYPSMAQRASSVEVLRILISIGPTETMHFQTWSDLAGDAPPVTDPTNGLTFVDLNSPPFGGETFTTSLIMPEPCPFLSRKLPVVSVIRPTETRNAANGALKFLTDMGLFIGQSPAFFEFMKRLANDADNARRGVGH
jgi:Ferritin-like domain